MPGPLLTFNWVDDDNFVIIDTDTLTGVALDDKGRTVVTTDVPGHKPYDRLHNGDAVIKGSLLDTFRRITEAQE